MDIKLVAYRGIVGNVSYFDPLSWMYLLNPRLDRIICVAEAIRQYLLGLRFLGLQIRREVPVTINKGHNPDCISHHSNHWINSAFLMTHLSWRVPHEGAAQGCSGAAAGDS